MAKKEHFDPGILALYDALITCVPGMERKGAAMPYTSINGNMNSFLDKEGTLALRLPASERHAFMKKYKTTLCEQHGTVLKEYVAVPSELFENPKTLSVHFKASCAYVSSLKPKPTKK